MRLVRVFIIVCAIIFTSFTAEAKISLNPEKSISKLIQEFRAAIQSIISTASWEFQVSTAQAVNNSNILLRNVEETYADTVDKTVKDLSNIEKDAFERLASLLDELETGADRVLDRPLSAIEDITALVADNVFGNKPIVTRFSPNYIGPALSTDVVRVAIGGLRLHTAEFAKPKLELAGEIFHGASTDRSITFDLPRDIFGKLADRPAYSTMKLTLEGKSETFAKRWLNIPQIVEYQLSMIVLPEKIGDFFISGAVSLEGTIREDFVPKPPHLTATGGPGMGTPEGHCYHAPEGTEFDLSTARPEWIERYGAEPGGGAGKLNPYVNIGQVIFDPRYAIDKKMICLLVTAGTGCKGCPARSVGKIVAQTVRKYTTERPFADRLTDLKWDDAEIKLDSDIQGHTLNISIFGGPRRSISLDKSVSISPFVRLEVSNAAKKAFIQPIVPAR
ncbi:hypothetical protein [Methylocella sp.]|uniref:hypothetical protein n=1 Tax=Methylocella sp. TaxID=1978226 RepID=UPI0035ADD236